MLSSFVFWSGSCLACQLYFIHCYRRQPLAGICSAPRRVGLLLCSVSLAEIELSFLKSVLFWEYVRQGGAGEAGLGARSTIAALAHGCNWASSEAVGSVAAFSAPEQTELVCRELSGCLGCLNSANWCCIIVFISLGHLCPVSASEHEIINLPRQKSLCWSISKALLFSWGWGCAYHLWYPSIFTLLDGHASIMGLIPGQLLASLIIYEESGAGG